MCSAPSMPKLHSQFAFGGSRISPRCPSRLPVFRRCPSRDHHLSEATAQINSHWHFFSIEFSFRNQSSAPIVAQGTA